jgi:type II secretory pathway component PulK
LPIANCQLPIANCQHRAATDAVFNLQFAICNWQLAIPRSRRTGVVLLIVLIVVAMLALGAYSFTRLMNVEAEGAKSSGRMLQARAAAESGVDYVAALLADQKLNGALGSDLYDSPELFDGQIVTDDSVGGTSLACRFCILAPLENGAVSNSLRFGLSDEAGRINLNALTAREQASSGQSSAGSSAASTAAETTNPLLYLPNMTEDIADAILDWLDSDDEPRAAGAESDFYQSLRPPYRAKNGPIHSPDELLLVRGVTARLLYGEDANRNGILDPNEDDGEQSYPYDDGDGTLDRGWSQYLTIYSRESNADATGQPRINLNGEDLEALFDQLTQDPDFGEEQATFIVAYRLFGPAQSGNQSGSSSQGQSGGSQQPGGSGGGPETGGSGGQRSSGDQSGAGSQSTKTIAGMDASGGAQHSIESVVDLIDVKVNAKMQGQQRTTALDSPYQSDAVSDFLDLLLDRTTTVADKQFVGRVNVNTASWPVLMSIPNMTEELADAVVASRPAESDSGAAVFNGGVAWLLASEAVRKDEFKAIEQYITGRSEVFSLQSVGYFESGGPTARVEAVIDLSGSSPRIRLMNDLTRLGRGYDAQVLLGGLSR